MCYGIFWSGQWHSKFIKYTNYGLVWGLHEYAKWDKSFLRRQQQTNPIHCNYGSKQQRQVAYLKMSQNMHRRSSNNIICFKSTGKFYCYYLVSKQQDDKEVRNNFCLGSHFWKKGKAFQLYQDTEQTIWDQIVFPTEIGNFCLLNTESRMIRFYSLKVLHRLQPEISQKRSCKSCSNRYNPS